jgi:hypothetical protein
MSKIVPSKMMSPPTQLMSDSLKSIQLERVRLLPQQHASTTYSPSGLNRISWRLPAYANSMLDTSRSFLSFKVKLTGSGTLDANNNATFQNGIGGIFERILIKNSAGLVIEDISNFNVLQKVLTLVSTEEQYKIDEGIYGTSEAGAAVGALMIPSADGIVYNYRFNTGVLSSDLSAYLPLFMMDSNGGFSLDVEIFLTPANSCMKANGTINADVSYVITEPVYNLALLRMDSALCSKYNEISCDPNSSIEIPFVTYKTHTQTLQSQTNIVHISETATNLKRIWSVYLDQSQTKAGNVLPFRGSVRESNGLRLTKYNYRVGTTYLFNEPVQETTNNNTSLQYVKDSIFAMKKPLIIAKSNSDQTATLYEDDNKFVTVANFEYSSESMNPAVIGGISSTNPIQSETTFDSTPSSAIVNHNFCEVGYVMTIRNGIVQYVEPKPGSQSVY